MSEVRCQKSDVRSQKSEVRSQKSDVGSQMSEVRGQKSDVGCQIFLLGSPAVPLGDALRRRHPPARDTLRRLRDYGLSSDFCRLLSIAMANLGGSRSVVRRIAPYPPDAGCSMLDTGGQDSFYMGNWVKAAPQNAAEVLTFGN